jgi:cellobiose phosphorylase
VEYSLLGLSERGLPRLNVGIGDWNDELNMISREGKGESVMLAMELCFMLRECAQVARAYGKIEQAEAGTKRYEALKSAINEYAWDGHWYLRAFADGEKELIPIGSSREEEGRIYLNTQTWAVLSGVAEEERAQVSMNAVEEHLMSEYGPLIYAPAYSKFNKHVGVASLYVPGWRNGCIYLRPVGWAVMAACVANRAEQASKMYRKACLPHVRKDIDRFST